MFQHLGKITVLLIIFTYGLSAQKTDTPFQGKLVYEHQVILIAEKGKFIPEELLALEELNYLTYYVSGPDTLIRTSAGVDKNLKAFTINTKDESHAYFYGSQHQVDFSALKKGSRVKVVVKPNDRKGMLLDLAYDCYDYETSTGDTGESCYAKDVPYTFPFNHKTAAKLKFPLTKEGLLTESTILSQVTEGLSWEISRKLILIEYNDQIDIEFPDFAVEGAPEHYEPIDFAEKEAKIIAPKFREVAKIGAVDSKGTAFDLSAFGARLHYVDLWASWCAPCINAFDDLQRLKKQYAAEDLQIVALSIDKKATKAAWETMIIEKSLAWPQFIMLEDHVPELREQIALEGIPRYLILDKNGFILVEDAPAPADPSLFELIDLLLDEEE